MINIFLLIVITIVVLLIVIFLFTIIYPSFGKNPSKALRKKYTNKNDLFYGGRFHNGEEFKLVVRKFKRETHKKKKIKRKPNNDIPVIKLNRIPKAKIDEMKVIWFGHSTSLVQMHGMNILIDPVFSKYVTPISNIGYKRMAEVPINIDDLPDIDLLLISHDHYDHLDYKTIIKIDKKVKEYCVPLGLESHLRRWGLSENKINSMGWWDEANIKGIEVISIPAQHNSYRVPWKMNSTWWSGYVLKDEYHSFYYTGDTGYGKFFKEINNQFGEIELVLVQTGQYDESWPYCHMKPEEAIRAVEDVGAKFAVPVHWAGFNLANHMWNEPAERFTLLSEGSSVFAITPMIGEIVDFNEINKYQKKWWREVK